MEPETARREDPLGEVAEGDVTGMLVEPGQISPYHCHPDATEIYFCYTGGGKMRTPERTIDVVRLVVRGAPQGRAARIYQRAAAHMPFSRALWRQHDDPAHGEPPAQGLERKSPRTPPSSAPIRRWCRPRSCDRWPRRRVQPTAALAAGRRMGRRSRSVNLAPISKPSRHTTRTRGCSASAITSELVRHLHGFRMKPHALLGHVDDQAIARGAGHLDLDARIAVEAVARGIAPFLEHRSPSSEAPSEVGTMRFNPQKLAMRPTASQRFFALFLRNFPLILIQV